MDVATAMNEVTYSSFANSDGKRRVTVGKVIVAKHIGDAVRVNTD